MERFKGSVDEEKGRAMKFQTYNATPGLERYPAADRFAVWKGAHKQLRLVDAQYRRRFHAYAAAIICLSCILATTCLGVGVVGIVIDLVLTVCLAGAIVYLAFRQQHFMNRRIGEYLRAGQDG